MVPPPLAVLAPNGRRLSLTGSVGFRKLTGGAGTRWPDTRPGRHGNARRGRAAGRGGAAGRQGPGRREHEGDGRDCGGAAARRASGCLPGGSLRGPEVCVTMTMVNRLPGFQGSDYVQGALRKPPSLPAREHTYPFMDLFLHRIK